mmetsp:Transcript_115168/g.357724  ORF Transcript_115168/g.357724 Transcript_115168/m.357724 type:complete len:303 (-) Transcript_115168:43-951(-)
MCRCCWATCCPPCGRPLRRRLSRGLLLRPLGAIWWRRSSASWGLLPARPSLSGRRWRAWGAGPCGGPPRGRWPVGRAAARGLAALGRPLRGPLPRAGRSLVAVAGPHAGRQRSAPRGWRRRSGCGPSARSCGSGLLSPSSRATAAVWPGRPCAKRGGPLQPALSSGGAAAGQRGWRRGMLWPPGCRPSSRMTRCWRTPCSRPGRRALSSGLAGLTRRAVGPVGGSRCCRATCGHCRSTAPCAWPRWPGTPLGPCGGCTRNWGGPLHSLTRGRSARMVTSLPWAGPSGPCAARTAVAAFRAPM